ncbi:MAG: hypothetical protein ACRCX2_24035 [Paraclostridium sp.]
MNKTFYRGHLITAHRDGEGAFYVVDGIMSCDFMSEALELINKIIEEVGQ